MNAPLIVSLSVRDNFIMEYIWQCNQVYSTMYSEITEGPIMKLEIVTEQDSGHLPSVILFSTHKLIMYL